MSEATATIETERPITLGDKLQKLIGTWLAKAERLRESAEYADPSETITNCAEELAHLLATHPQESQP